MALALRIKNRFKFSTVSTLDLSSLKQWLFGGGGLSGTQVIDAKGDETRTLHPARAYHFDGTDDYIDSGYTMGASLTTITVCAWVRLDSLGSFQHIMGNINSGLDEQFTFRVDSDNKAQIGTYDGSQHQAKSTTTLTTTQWYFLAGTFDGSDYKIYVNGTLEATTTDSTFAAETATDYFIGARNGPGGSADLFFDGKMYGFALWESVLTDSEIQNIYNDHNYKASPNVMFKMDESAGTTAYNSGSDANDGTITNATLSTFHHTDDSLGYSWQNQVGYSDGAGGVLIPRDESNTANDAAGNALDYTGRAKYNADLVESSCITLDGVDDFVDIGNEGSSIKSISFWVKIDSDSTTYYVLDLNGTDYITIVSGTVTVNGFAAATTTIYVNDAVSSSIPDTTDFHHVAISSDTGFTASDMDIGRLEGTGFFAGQLADIRTYTAEITAGNVSTIYGGDTLGTEVILLPCAEGNGSTLYDVSGNDNHGTITGASLSSNTQDVFHWNIRKGFEEYDDDATGNVIIRVPYKSDASQITPTISGYTKNQNNPAGDYHNQAETKLKLPIVIPALLLHGTFWMNDSKVLQSRNYSDIDRDFNTKNITLADISTNRQRKNLVTYKPALSGSDLTNVKSLLNH